MGGVELRTRPRPMMDVMQGTLTQTSVAELCLQLQSQEASGTLAVSSAAGEGTLTFSGGALVAARAPSTANGRGARLGERLVHSGRLRQADLDRTLAEQTDTPLGSLLVETRAVGADAVRVLLQEQVLDSLAEMLAWHEGEYAFAPGAEASTGLAVTVDAGRAVTEAERRTVERTRLATLVPSPESVPSPLPAAARPATLSAEASLVLDAVDGVRSVRLIATTLGFSEAEVTRLLYQLALMRQVAVSAPDTPHATNGNSHAAAPPADLTWADQRAATIADEPEPWVGYAHAPQGVDVDVDPPPTPAPRPVAQPWLPTTPTTTPASATLPWESDHDTRRALFSELHGLGGSGAPPASQPSPPAADAATDQDATPTGAPAPDQDAGTTGPPTPAGATQDLPPARSPLSRGDVSDLLAALHALNLDDDTGP